jgi:sigma-B regulation protein RsbU (phosphoserine phosphatase)
MWFSPASLKQRFTILLIIPVTLLLIIMGIAGFFYARDLLLDQWQDAAILRLQRAAHEVDMHLSRINNSIRLFHETSGGHYTESFHVWALEHLSRQEGVVEVKLTWTREERTGAEPQAVQPAPPPGPGPRTLDRPGRMRRFHSANIREITPPRFDTRREHDTLSLISDLLDDRRRTMGQLEVICDFDFIFRHVVKSGWWQSNKAFLVDEKGQILIGTAPERRDSLGASGDPLERETLRMLGLNPFGTLRGPGHPAREVSGFYHLREVPWILVMIAPGEEILAPIIQFRWYYSLFALGFMALIIGLIRLVTTRMASQIREVSQAALRLSRGEFGRTLPVMSRDEVGELTRSFNQMTSQLQERLHLKEAMNLAMEVQQNLLPAAPPPVPGLDIAGRSLYCQETGGDYFDYILRPGPTGSRRLCVAVGDVVGHGISAALLMTTVRALLRSRLDRQGSIAEAVCDVNRLLCRDTTPSGSFVTLFLLEADPFSGALEWVRAGHDPAVFYDASEDHLQELNGPGMALGVDEACGYLSGSLTGWAAGDAILIGTDGVWETQNTQSEKFGKTRIGEIIRSHRQGGAAEILQAILGALEEFRGDAIQQDDITLLIIKAVKTAQT